MDFFVVVYAIAVLLGALLFVEAKWIPARPVGAVLLFAGAAVFFVRLLQAGSDTYSFSFPNGFDLAAGLGGLFAGALLLARKRLPDARWLLAIAPVVLVGAAIATAHEVGEIVVLRTTDERGERVETRLAVLDYDGSTWVGAGSGRQRRWFRHLAEDPEVEVVRGGAAACYVAVPETDARRSRAVFRELEEKYLVARAAAALGHHLFLDDGKSTEVSAIAVRLEPCPSGG